MINKEEFREKFTLADDGCVFEFEEHKYLKVTGMVAKCIDTDQYFMLGIDF